MGVDVPGRAADAAAAAPVAPGTVVNDFAIPIRAPAGISSTSTAELIDILTRGFNPSLPVTEASTPPSEWYTQAEWQAVEKDTIFKRNWIPVGRVDQLQKPGDFFTGHMRCSPSHRMNSA